MDPKALKPWLIALALVYLLFPRDLVFDFAGRGLGFLDDLVLIGLLRYWYRNYTRQFAARQQQEGTGAHAGDSGASGGGARASQPGEAPDSDPAAVLGVGRDASQQEIQAAYRARMREYHPDKVAHLGEDLQKLAHRKSLEIQQAYRRLRR